MAEPLRSETRAERGSVVVVEPSIVEELRRLQGAWATIAGRRAAELLVAGRRFTIWFEDGDVYVGAFEIDAEARPRRMEMRIDEGPARHKGKTARCIYELEGEALRWCAAEPGAGNRPTAFPFFEDVDYLSLLFGREKML